ncbi:hypothetical protein CIG75_08190 [Tumebacillus algifaecis]|uniref:Prepilin-type cleavage/methylation domain-containing protein n=1 Tax=Tumebacillus algifaecis TaxID=1214604 RepID=A0A223D0T1_9BACL|nr:hypothetical protein [Tumebacillus algifaecis]ASS74967.1 hypothetical protein CIG75_08190 [Tumebacillus algifaecis]
MSKRGRRFIADERGVTLLELVLSLAVTGLLLPVFAAWMTAMIAQWQQVSERIEVRQTNAVLLHRIGAEVREGSSFLPQRNGLVFLNKAGRLIRYQLSSGGLLLRDEEGVGATVIGSHLAECRFSTDQEGRVLTVHLGAISQSWVGRGNR